MPEPKRTCFVTLLTPDIRRRHEHSRVGKQIISFSVQIEVFWRGRWTFVVRYDTAHGFAHRDLFWPSGRVDKTPLFVRSFTDALDFAEADLRANWRSYVERFTREEDKR